MRSMTVVWLNMHTIKKEMQKTPLFKTVQRPELLSKRNLIGLIRAQIGCEGAYKNH